MTTGGRRFTRGRMMLICSVLRTRRSSSSPYAAISSSNECGDGHVVREIGRDRKSCRIREIRLFLIDFIVSS